MKKLLLAALAFLLITPTISFAEPNAPDSILFRGIAWYEAEGDVEKTISSVEGIKPSWYKPVDESARIDGWDRKYSMMYADPNITDGGVILNYDNAMVAGYSSSLKASFMYAIVDGRVQYETQTSKFYKAEYVIEDLEDMEGVYNDLKSKLTDVYGAPQDNSHVGFLTDLPDPAGSLWVAKDGSLVNLYLYYNSVNERYDSARITYAAPNSDDRLNELDDQIKKEAVEAENATRESNSDNYEGL